MENELEKLNEKLELYPDRSWLEAQHKLTERYISEGGMTYKSRCRATLLGLGFLESELSLPLEKLSGGQRTRVLLAKILLSGSDLLLLDEPTNHLDVHAIQWLEDFLSSYKGAVMVISHDRYFLDKICNKIYELENETLREYKGNYTKFKEQKALDRLSAQREYDKKQKEIERIEGIIEQQKRFGQERNFVTIKSKQKQIEHIKATVVEPEKDPDEVSFAFKACSETGQDALIVENVTQKFGDRTLFSNVNMLIKAKDRAFIVGPNGSGKTTLFRIILGEQIPTGGICKNGARVKYGYYDQNISGLDMSKTIFDEISDSFPTMTNGQIRSALGTFLFRGDEVFKEISKLSGGERARVELAKLMLCKTNFLILDEPTNHLDIASKEALEDALLEYDGTMLVVSHDRYFINKLATQIYAMEDSPQGQGSIVVHYPGGYENYLAELEKKNQTVRPETSKQSKENEYYKKKAEDSDRRKRKSKIAKIETELETLDSEKHMLEQKLSDGSLADDYEKMLEISERIAALTESYGNLYSEWEKLVEEDT
jgi:ATP-binding cassette subfamily F protein 3